MWIRIRLIFPVFIAVLLHVLSAVSASSAEGGAFRYWKAAADNDAVPLMNVVGFKKPHVIEENTTLLDIARDYGLGFNEISLLYPDMDPWIPPKGTKIDIPMMWVLPPTRHEALVINIPEMRIYRFFREHKLVKTYPLGIGRQGFNTPITDTRVATRIRHPEWTVPPALRDSVGRATVPPGPANPLGDYWIGLGVDNIGIHGTNFPWGIGRRVSHGCLRMYPEDVKSLFNEISVGTRVEILYEPVKVGLKGNTIFLEVHPDIHAIIPDMYRHTESLLKKCAVLTRVDRGKVRRALDRKSGVPVPVGILKKR